MNHSTHRTSQTLLQLAAGAVLVISAALLPTSVAAADRAGQYTGGDAGLLQVGVHGRHNGSRSSRFGGSRRFNNHRFNNHRFSNSRHFNNSRFRSSSRFGFNRGFSRNHRNDFRGRNSLSNQGYGNSCSKVSKLGSWNGRYAHIGGLQCIDSQGYAYIPPESRYLISYQ